MTTCKLAKEKHITYWLRCLKVFLPSAYRSMDSNRMMLAYFTLSSLDLLDALFPKTTPEERAHYTDWIYHCQRPDGGFRGSPVSNFGDKGNETNAAWDPASIPATYFALSSLLILRDDFSRLKKKECLKWLKKMQRSDGSFGQTLGENGKIEGGFDTRFAYTAMGIRWILKTIAAGDVSNIEDIDAEALAKKIGSLQTYDGGISDDVVHEAHSGYSFCAVATLSIIGKLPGEVLKEEQLMHWLVYRATTKFELDEEEEETEEMDVGASDQPSREGPEVDCADSNHDCLGFNGRCNKIADTCYAWWSGATMQLLGKLHFFDFVKAQQYLLKMTQHRIGGFSKYPGDPPDIFHSYFGLASLSMLGHADLKKIHTAACISMDAVEYLESLKQN